VFGSWGSERRRLHSLGAFQCLVLAALAAPLDAQDSVVVVPDAPSCTTCSLDISLLVELGDREGPGIVGEQAWINRSDDGDYYLSSSLAGEEGLMRFSPDGVFQEVIGRHGEGPGEYAWPMLMGGSADDLTILDVAGRRFTTIRNGEVATISMSFASKRHALLPDGRHLYNAIVFEPDRIGHPLHVYDPESRRITRSFGDEGVRVDRSSRSHNAMNRPIAVAADGHIWAARVNRYQIDKWNPNDGVRIARIERDAPWFRPWLDFPEQAPIEDRPSPELVGVGDWGDDLLMVVVRVADSEWKPVRPARIERGHEVISGAQMEELYDTVIEVLDTRLGTVVARTQVDANVWRVIGKDGFYSYAEHSDLGEPKHVVWSVALSGYSR